MAAEEPKKTRARKPATPKAAAKTTAAKKPAARNAATPRARKTAAQPVVPRHEQVAFRAFELYEHGAHGDALEHWLIAEQELIAA
jgi:hypothetical protein